MQENPCGAIEAANNIFAYTLDFPSNAFPCFYKFRSSNIILKIIIQSFGLLVVVDDMKSLFCFGI